MTDAGTKIGNPGDDILLEHIPLWGGFAVAIHLPNTESVVTIGPEYWPVSNRYVKKTK